MNVVKIGVVGVGNMGSYHCQKLKGMKNVDLIGVYDPDFQKANTIGNKLSVNVYPTYQELLMHVDAVIIAAPTKFHFSLAKEAIQLDKHLFVEKPIAVSLEETSKLKELQNKKNIILQVGHIERFNPVVGQLKKLVEEDQIIFMEAKRLGLSSRIKDVDVVLDVMIHDIDIVLSLVRSPIIDISAAGVCFNMKGNYDYVTALLTFENGIISSLVASNISHEKERTLIITEKERMIKTDYLSRQQLIVKNTAANPICKSGYPTEFLMEKIAIQIADPLTQELEHFVECIQHNKQPEVSLKEGEAALEVALKIKSCLQ
ncbi:Gfo/Idh/MocA family oxidoreductase [Fredinandcohnia sp. 179-A 10B2 NHS]|uniref:Gfo/Idh/MocA family oxidoreductase n=1 Tax=Fredinandcohnia sp. 179-A 10B2 NHS TaxID=3235176 RepID=UPI0039A27DBD